MEISVAIVTYQDDDCLNKLIERLLQQTHPAKNILVIDADNSNETQNICQAFASETVQYIKTEENNLGLNRALAVQICSSPWIAFIDSDAYPRKTWLKQLSEKFNELSLSTSKLAALAGQNVFPNKNTTEKQQLHYLALKKMAQTFIGHFNSPQAKQYKIDTKVPHLPTTNILYHKASLIEANNFSCQFPRVGEDVDISLSLRQKGFSLFITPEIEVEHFTDFHFKHWCHRIFRFGYGQIRVLKKHPKLHASFKLVLPIVFIFTIFGFSILSLENHFFLIPVLFYFIFITILSFIQTWRETIQLNLFLFPYLFFLYLGTHFSYAAGEICGVFETIANNRKQKPRTINKDT